MGGFGIYRRTVLWRHAVGLVGVAALGLAAVGCGSSASPFGRQGHLTNTELTAAINRTGSVRSAHVVETIHLGTSAGSEQIEVQATADFRTVTGRTAVTSSQGENEHALYRGSSVWLASNEFKSYLPAGKTWVSSTVHELESMGAFQPLNHGLAILNVLRGVEKLHTTGPGRATFTFSLARATARTPASQRTAFHTAIHATGGRYKETGSVWVDSSIVRSLSVRIDGTGQTAGTKLRYDFTLSDVGTHVDVAPPPAKAVVPLQSVPALEERLRSSAAGG